LPKLEASVAPVFSASRILREFFPHRLVQDEAEKPASLPASPEVIEVIKRAVEGVEGVKEVDAIKLRNAGSLILGEITIKVNGKTTVYELDRIATKIQEIGKRQIDNLSC
jgi:copper chaperone CopZ